MSFTHEQQAERLKYLTASRAPAVLGLDPWKSPADVLAEYTLPLDGDNAGEAAEIGLDIEPALVAWAVRVRGLGAPTMQRWAVSPNGVMAATLDATVGESIGIEAKTAGILNPAGIGDEWGESGTDQIPTKYLIQVAAQFVAAPMLETILVPALIGGRGRALYEVERAKPEMRDLIAEVEIRCVAWWRCHVVDRVPMEPDAPAPSMETLRRVRREPASVIDLTGDAEVGQAVAAWRELTTAAGTAAKLAEDAKARALALLGTAEAARVVVDGETKLLKYMVEPRKGYTVAASEPRVARLVKLPKGGF